MGAVHLSGCGSHAQHRLLCTGLRCAATAEFDKAAAAVTASAEGAAAADFDSAAAAVAAANTFGARGDGADTKLPAAAGKAAASTEAGSTGGGSTATCVPLADLLPAEVADMDECLSPAKAAPVGVATGLLPAGQGAEAEPQLCYQSAPPPPLAAFAQPEDRCWCAFVISHGVCLSGV